jgi:hypothetical protein
MEENSENFQIFFSYRYPPRFWGKKSFYGSFLESSFYGLFSGASFYGSFLESSFYGLFSWASFYGPFSKSTIDTHGVMRIILWGISI